MSGPKMVTTNLDYDQMLVAKQISVACVMIAVSSSCACLSLAADPEADLKAVSKYSSLSRDISAAETRMDEILCDPKWWERVAGSKELSEHMIVVRDLRFKKCSPYLAEHIDARSDSFATATSMTERYPAMAALVTLGNPGIEAIVHELKQTFWPAANQDELIKLQLLGSALREILSQAGDEDEIMTLIMESQIYVEGDSEIITSLRFAMKLLESYRVNPPKMRLPRAK